MSFLATWPLRQTLTRPSTLGKRDGRKSAVPMDVVARVPRTARKASSSPEQSR